MTAVGGLIFLRFFCPAIVAPDAIGLVKDMSMKDPRRCGRRRRAGARGLMSRSCRRGLVLITKAIQNLANNVDFGSKEAFMAPLNDNLRFNLPKVEVRFCVCPPPSSSCSPAAAGALIVRRRCF